MAVAALACALGCGNGDLAASVDERSPSGTPAAGAEERVGSLALALTAPNGVELETFRYAITGPSFTKAGDIDVSDSTTVSVLIEGIPVASGYSITLTGTSPAPTEATCSGSASFAVAAGEVTDVLVPVACHVEEQAPPSQPTPVPVPPIAPVVLGLLLLAVGTRAAGRRRES